MGEVGWPTNPALAGRWRLSSCTLSSCAIRQQEARLIRGQSAWQLSHRNVVQIYDFFETESTVALVLEYVPDGSLADRIERQGALEPTEVVSIMTDVLAGLHALHNQAMLHRDVKPDNVLTLQSGKSIVAKLTDLGVVQQEKGTRLTRDGSRLGTPEYMAPEQIKEGKTSG